MVNITGDGNFTSKLNQALSPLPAGMIEFFLTLNIFLSITASLGNVLILIALHKVSSIHPPTKLFFRCLAVTDLCVGLVVQPLFVTLMLAYFTNMNVTAQRSISNTYNVSSVILCGVSSLITTAISVDRLLALLLGLRYRHVVTLRRVRVVITCFWLISASGGSIMMWRRDIAINIASVHLTLSVVISFFCYRKIHLKLRHQQQNTVPGGQTNGRGIPMNIARYKKSVSSILWVQLALAACYVPWSILTLLSVIGIENYMAWITTQTLIHLNSSLNPILYCLKIKEVRQAVKATIKRLDC